MIKIPDDMIQGTIHPTRKWGDVEILDYLGRRDVSVRFVDTDTVRTVRAELIRKGVVEDPMVASAFGIGFLGVGPYAPATNAKEHIHWKGLLERSYCPKLVLKRPTYLEVVADIKWHNFQNFAPWCHTQKGFINKGWELDKDLLIKGNKIYSPETCVFLPPAINAVLVKGKGTRDSALPIGVTYSEHGTGYRAYCSDKRKTLSKRSSSVEECFAWYKNTKECVIKSLADEYAHLLDEVAYKALYNYEVEWSD